MHLQTIPLPLGQNISVGSNNMHAAMQQQQNNQNQFLQNQNFANNTSLGQAIVFQQKAGEQSIYSMRDIGMKPVRYI